MRTSESKRRVQAHQLQDHGIPLVGRCGLRRDVAENREAVGPIQNARFRLVRVRQFDFELHRQVHAAPVSPVPIPHPGYEGPFLHHSIHLARFCFAAITSTISSSTASIPSPAPGAVAEISRQASKEEANAMAIRLGIGRLLLNTTQSASWDSPAPAYSCRSGIFRLDNRDPIFNEKILIALVLALACSLGWAADKVPAHPHILVETTEGNFKLELDGKAAPLTVANFLKLVESGSLRRHDFPPPDPGFHGPGRRLPAGFKKREPEETVPNESGNGLQNLRGTIAMARTGDPHSAGSQFFINVVGQCEHEPRTRPISIPTKHTTQGRWGYAVFGFVFEGMEVVDKIVNAKTLNNGPGGAPAPIVPIIVNKMSLITYE